MLLKMPFHGIMTKILKMAQSLQSLMLDAKIFCLKMQNNQVPICSQYGIIHYFSLTAQFFK